MDGTLLVAAGTAVLTGLGVVEQLVHRRHLNSIPIRIHVNGTRGKSGVARLIAAGLRAGGIRTCAKTTGTLARFIFPDGSEYPIHRPGRANVIEQVRIVRAAARARTEALVVECMALQPVLQSLCELKLIRATHGVITNARADHLDVMGPTTDDVAGALAGTVPVNARLYTAEQRRVSVFRNAARERNSQLIEIGDDEIAEVTWDELERFPYVEHPDNVALALQVCRDLGVERSVALSGMWNAPPDAGVMRVFHDQQDQQQITFVNGFAANDPESTGKIWELVLSRYTQLKRRIAIINCRADRHDRSQQLAESCLQWTPADHYLVIGTGTDAFANRVIAGGLSRDRITQAERQGVDVILRRVSELARSSALVMGIGNIAGPGMDLVNHYREQHGQSIADSNSERRAPAEIVPFPFRESEQAPAHRKAA